MYTLSTIDRLQRGRGRQSGGNGSVGAVGGGWTPRYFICHWNWNELEGGRPVDGGFRARPGNANAEVTKRSRPARGGREGRASRTPLARPFSESTCIIGLCVIRTPVVPDGRRRWLRLGTDNAWNHFSLLCLGSIIRLSRLVFRQSSLGLRRCARVKVYCSGVNRSRSYHFLCSWECGN